MGSMTKMATATQLRSRAQPAPGVVRMARDAPIRQLLALGILLSDALAILLAAAVVQLAGDGLLVDATAKEELALVALSLPAWALLARAFGLRGPGAERAGRGVVDELPRIVGYSATGAWLLVAVGVLIGTPRPGEAATFAFTAALLLAALRPAARGAAVRLAGPRKAIIVGAGHVGQLMGRKLIRHPEYGIELVGFADDAPRDLRVELRDVPVLGGLEALEKVVLENGIDTAFVAFSAESAQDTLAAVRRLEALNLDVNIVPRLFEAVGPSADLARVEALPFIALPRPRTSLVGQTAKRTLDIVVATLLLVLTSPLFAVFALLIKRDSPGPVFYRQRRLGHHMRTFTSLKFRTMYVGTSDEEHRRYIAASMDAGAAPEDSGLYKLDRDADVTRIGAFLRRTSLDELPQLLNVLRGDMSLVGPRPCLRYETENFQPHHFVRFTVPAGLTGLWQVTARANSTFGEALEMDVAYVRSRSFVFDLMILIQTPFVLLRGRQTT